MLADVSQGFIGVIHARRSITTEEFHLLGLGPYITGGIAKAFYGCVHDAVVVELKQRLEPDLWETTEAFNRRYCRIDQ